MRYSGLGVRSVGPVGDFLEYTYTFHGLLFSRVKRQVRTNFGTAKVGGLFSWFFGQRGLNFLNLIVCSA